MGKKPFFQPKGLSISFWELSPDLFRYSLSIKISLHPFYLFWEVSSKRREKGERIEPEIRQGRNGGIEGRDTECARH